MPNKKPYRPGPYEFLLKLPSDLNLDLHAFSELFYNASPTEICRRALTEHIEREVAEPAKSRQFADIRTRLSEEGRVDSLRLVDADEPNDERTTG